MTRDLILPMAALLVAAGGVGLILGLRAIPPDAGEIIARHAADYAARTGGEMTDCHGVPSELAGVRLIVVCERPGLGSWRVAVDRFGAPVAALPDAQGPRT